VPDERPEEGPHPAVDVRSRSPSQVGNFDEQVWGIDPERRQRVEPDRHRASSAR
jgi:hypothetical protein